MKAQSWKNVRARAVTEERVNETHVQEVKQRMMHDLQAQKLAELRRAAGLNQQELAERLGMTQSRVSRIERGELERTELFDSAGFCAGAWREAGSGNPVGRRAVHLELTALRCGVFGWRLVLVFHEAYQLNFGCGSGVTCTAPTSSVPPKPIKCRSLITGSFTAPI